MQSKPSADSAQHTLWDLIRDIKFALLTTINAQGQLRARPMTTQNRRDDDNDRLWFFTSKSSGLADEIRDDARVCVAYGDPDADSWVSVSGRARFVEDTQKKHALWSPMVKAWFPGGVDDPDVGLLEVHIENAEYWDVKNSKMVQLAKMAAAAVSGRPPQMTEHREVDFNR